MKTELSEVELFHRFVAEQIKNGGRNLSLDEILKAFRAYEGDLERCREAIRPALERSLRGESEPFDVEEMKTRVTNRLAEKGISD